MIPHVDSVNTLLIFLNHPKNAQHLSHNIARHLSQSFSKVGQLLGEHARRIWTIFNHWIGLAYQADDPTGVTQLGFDETSRRKGHNYLTVAVDLEEHRVLHVVKGKDSNTIKEIRDYLVNP